MHRLFALTGAMLLACVLTVPTPARAYNEEAVLSCVFKQALGILTCKKPDKYSFVGIREGIYVYNSLFGSRFVEFYVQINGDMAIFTSRAWNGRMPSGRILHDAGTGCVTVTVEALPCSLKTVARCCGPQ